MDNSEALQSLHEVDYSFFKETNKMLEEYFSLYKTYREYYIHRVGIPYEVKKGFFKGYKTVPKYKRLMWLQKLLFITTAVPFDTKEQFEEAFLETRARWSNDYAPWESVTTKLYTHYYPDDVDDKFRLHHFGKNWSAVYDDIRSFRHVVEAVLPTFHGKAFAKHWATGQQIISFNNIKEALKHAREAVEALPNKGSLV